MSTIVIAEPGACHDRDWQRMVEMVDASVAAGADVFKPQFWGSSDALASQRRATIDYQLIYQRYRMPFEWLPRLADYCRGTIDLACSVYLPADCALVAPYVSALKVASFEAGSYDLLRAACATGKQVIVSTGMMAMDEVLALRLRLAAWACDFRLLHCVSAYPTPDDATNLAVLGEQIWRPGAHPAVLVERSDWVFDGFSDHTDPAVTVTGAIAAAAGADMVEAHIRHPETDPKNPDFPHAMTPEQFTWYVGFIRMADRMMGTSVKAQQPSEAPMVAFRVTE